MGNPANISIGPGLLHAAAMGTAEPTDNTTPLIAAYQEIGYTEEGTTFRWTTTSEAIEVAEELEPVGYEMTKRVGVVMFAMAEATRRNLGISLNMGLLPAIDDADPIEPNAIGSEVRLMLVHQAESGARWLFRKCLAQGQVEIRNKKAPAKKLIGVEFNLELPSTPGVRSFKVFPTALGVI